jgi:hypothetical protein
MALCAFKCNESHLPVAEPTKKNKQKNKNKTHLLESLLRADAERQPPLAPITVEMTARDIPIASSTESIDSTEPVARGRGVCHVDM